jgi:RND family efflux transporter MFP subunit
MRPTCIFARKSGSVICLLALALAGCRPGADVGPPAAGAAPLAAAPPRESLEVVVAGPPVRKSLTLFTVQPARVEPIEATPMQSKMAAYVAEVTVDFGDRVEKGQPLVKLTAPELGAELGQKKALFEQARAELAQAESGVKAAEAAVATAEARVKESQAAIDRAQAEVRLRQLEHSRAEQLVASGSINQQLVDEAQHKLSAAEASAAESLAAAQSVKALVEQAAAEADRTKVDVEAARSRIHVAAANIEQVEALQSYLVLKAPFDGIVTDRRIDPGHFVQPASGESPPLVIVARTDKMRVIAPVPESEAAYVDIGDAVTIEIPSLRSAEFAGQVTRTSLSLGEGSRALDAIIDLDNADGRLRPGMYATARVTLQEQEDVLTLPAAAIVRSGKEAFCYRLVDGKAEKLPIQLGLRVGDDFEVTSGLAESDTVILNKASALKDGQSVEATRPAAAPAK